MSLTRREQESLNNILLLLNIGIAALTLIHVAQQIRWD